MSVALLVEDASGGGRSLPVATEVVFERSWLPVCEELGLEWLPLFESGLPVAEEDRPFVLAELERFEKTIRAADPDSEIADRARSLTDALRAIDFGSGTSAYIG